MTHGYIFKVKDNVTPALIVLFSWNVAINLEHIYILCTKKPQKTLGQAGPEHFSLLTSFEGMHKSDDLFLAMLLLPARVGGSCIHSNTCENSYAVELAQCRLILFLLVSICQGKYYTTVWNGDPCKILICVKM